MSELRKRAQAAQDGAQTDDRYRPQFHLSVPVGWLNDPNGLCWYQGRCHLFYQYHPHDSVWGPMYWGHWSSADLLNWRVEPVAMAPDEAFDAKGCFSGTALAYDGKLVVLYTGVCEESPEGRWFQQQCLAESADGIHFTKYGGNPVIGRDLFPAEISPYDFRDPKLEKTAHGFRVVTAAKGADGGQLLTFTSPDLVHWTCAGPLLRGVGEMTECPDYFELDGKRVLICCVMGAEQEDMPNQQPVVYWVGEEKAGELVPEEPMRAVDWGLDFYAPQTTLLPDGRRMLVGWAQQWGDVMATHRLGHGWSGTMTSLRECRVVNGRLLQRPIREYEQLRGQQRTLPPTSVSGTLALPEMAGTSVEIELTADMTRASRLELRLMQSADGYFSIQYDRVTGQMKVDRANCGYPLTEDGTPEKKPFTEAPYALLGHQLHLHILADVSIIEVFAGDGELVMTSMAFPREMADGVSLVVDGEAQVEMQAWAMARKRMDIEAAGVNAGMNERSNR